MRAVAGKREGVEEVVDAAAGRAKALFVKLVAQMRTRPIRRHCIFMLHPLFMLLAMWSSLFGSCCEVQVVRVLEKKGRTKGKPKTIQAG